MENNMGINVIHIVSEGVKWIYVVHNRFRVKGCCEYSNDISGTTTGVTFFE